MPDGLDSENFRAAWAEWENHRRHLRKPLTPEAVKRQHKKLAAWGEARAIAALNHSIENGWTGVFEPGGDKAAASNPQVPTTEPAIVTEVKRRQAVIAAGGEL